MSVRICAPSKLILLGGIVGAAAGVCRARPEPRHVEHAPARGDDAAVGVERGAGVRHLDSLGGGRLLQPVITSPLEEDSG